MRIRFAGLVALLMVASVAPLIGKVSGGTVVGESVQPKGNFIKLSIPLGNPYGPANSVGENILTEFSPQRITSLPPADNPLPIASLISGEICQLLHDGLTCRP